MYGAVKAMAVEVKAIMAAVTTPGAIRGRVILKNALAGRRAHGQRCLFIDGV